MTGREEAMLIVLEEIFPMYRFHAQVAMGALLKDPTTGRVVALIEVDDGSHNAARDRIRDT